MPFGLRLLLACALLASIPPTVEAQFTEIAGDVGLTQRDLKDGGLTFADFNGDGWLDALVNGRNTHLYFSTGGPDPTFDDVTDTNAPGIARRRTDRAAVAADLNNDGYNDILRSDQQLFEIYLNRGPMSDPAFHFGDPGSGDPDMVLDSASDPALDAYEGIGVFDYDRDGWLDFVLNNDQEVRLLENPQDGTAAFVAIDAMTSLLPGPGPDPGDYVAVTDWDVDGFVDVAYRHPNQPDLHHNEGDGTFAAFDFPDLGSPNDRRGGIAFCDFDNDGDFDFFYTSGTGAGINRVWRREADGSFVNTGEPDFSSSSVDGVACGDIDNDGDADLFITRTDTDHLYINQLAESGSFALMRDNRGITGSRNGEGTVMVDFDRDGDLDIYLSQRGPTTTDPVTMMSMTEPANNELWRNDLDDTNYLAVEVLTEVVGCPARVNRTDHGAVVSVAQASGAWASGVQDVNGGMGHGTQGSPILHFGLPPGPDEEYVVTARFQDPAVPIAEVRVRPSSLGNYQLLTVLSTDPDADGIPTSVEMADTAALGSPDPDGDGRPAWHDPDADGDGILDSVEDGDGDPCTPPDDDDGSGTPDYLEGPMVPGRDGGVLIDGGSIPREAGTPRTGLEVHGSGCARCAVGSPSGSAGWWWLAACVALVLRRRRIR